MSGPFDLRGDVRFTDIAPAVSLQKFGLQSSGDNTNALQRALDSGESLAIPEGRTIQVGGLVSISRSGPVSIKGLGDNSVLDFSSGGRVSIVTPLVAMPALASPITAGTASAEFVSSHGLSPGDVFIVYNPVDYSWGPARPYYRDGCMFRVSEIVSGTVVRFYGLSDDAYAVETSPGVPMQVYRIAGAEVLLDDFRIIPPPPGQLTINIDGRQGVRIGRIRHDIHSGAGSNATGINIARSFDVDVIGSRTTARTNPGADAYPITLSNVQQAKLSGLTNYSHWHAIALGGAALPGCVPTRDVLISDSILRNDRTAGVGAADMHGCVSNIVYDNCILDGAHMAGRDVTIQNSTIYGRGPTEFLDGNAIYGSEVFGGHYRLLNTRIVTFGSGTAIGVIHLNLPNLTRDFRLTIRNLAIDGRTSGSAAVRGIQLELGGATLDASTHRVDVDIDGYNYEGGNLLNFVGFTGLRNIAGKGSLRLKNYSSRSTGCNLAAFSLAANKEIPMQIGSISGVYSGTTTVTTAINASPITFRYVFPRVPSSSVGVRGVGGAAMTTVGGQTATPGAYTVTTTAIRPTLLAPANFTAGATYEQPWTVEINDAL